MAPAYKLTYFDGRGAAESVRFLFKYGNIEFEDVRIKQEDWPKLKDTTPFGQLPILEHNGKKLNQSIAMTRFVGRLVKLAGNNEWESLEIDAVIDSFNDVRQKVGVMAYEKDEERKKALRESIVNETIPFYFSRLDATVEKNNGYLALGRLTWADFYFAAAKPGICMMLGDDVFNKYPNLEALTAKIHALPAIKKWVEERPQTAF